MNIETANRLLKFRKAHHLSQEELAEKIGVSRQAISKWERAEASPDTDNLILLSKIYGVTLDELLQGEAEPENDPSDNDDSKVGAGSPDKDTSYVEKGEVSFKNGIHVHDKDGDNVDISFKNGIHVDAKDGTHVHIDHHGVHVREGDKTRAYTTEDGHIMVDEEIAGEKKKNPAYLVPVWLFALIAFLLWGFSGAVFGFALSWICLFAIPLYYSLVDAFVKRNPSHFAYPVLCAAAYILMGYFSVFGGWALGWIVFLTIPIYYWVAEMIKQLAGKKKK